MSTSPEADYNLELHFLPAWAKESPQTNRYENFQAPPERRGDRRDDRRPGGPRGERRDRPPRRDQPFGRGPGGPGGPGGFGGPGRPGGGPGRPGGEGRPPRREGREGGPRRDGRGHGPGRRGEGERPAAPAPVPLPDVQVAFVPDDQGVDSLTRQIRMTGRAYPLFEIAQMILAKPERHSVTFSVKKNGEGKPVQPLFICAIDETLWLSEDAAMRHVLDRHFALFYQAERTQIDPPKGTYTFVAQCGLSGVVLGPPNHHDYQNNLRRLHAQRFGRMPFEAFKARVRIVKDPEVVKKWIEEQSWKTEFLCLNLPESLKLGSRAEVEKHFRETHLANIVKPVETCRLKGTASRNQRDRDLQRLIRVRWEDQRRFPMQVATALSQQFAARGLQFFKVNRTVTHVAVARPSYLDLETTPVSEGVRRIVEYVNAHPKCTHKQLLDALAPTPAVIPVVPAAPPAPAPAPEGTAEAASAEVTPAAPVAPPPSAEPSPELAAVMMDLHWLVQQGNVIEFANGVLETAKKPAPRPPKPEAKPAGTAAAADAAAATPALPDEGAPDEGEVSGPSEPIATATDAVAPVEPGAAPGSEAAPAAASEGGSPEPEAVPSPS